MFPNFKVQVENSQLKSADVAGNDALIACQKVCVRVKLEEGNGRQFIVEFTL